MSNLDEISVAIGSLQAEAASGRNQRADQYKKIDEISKSMAAMEAHMENISSGVAVLTAQAGDHGERISSLEKSRAKMVGMATASGGIVGFASTWLSKLINTPGGN